MKKQITKSTGWALIAFYLLIAFEFFYMASPFAAYFYSVYKPALTFLDKFPYLAWTTGFFLPHIVENTNSAFINSITIVGLIFTTIGLLSFIICALQVYYAKLFKRGIVTGGLYKFIRHPQYTAFIICSFGLLLLWPRYIALIMFVTVLFAYYFLAKTEEKECERKYDNSYAEYKNKTHMFIPFVKFNLPKRFGLRGIPKVLAFLLIFILSQIISVQTAHFVKRQSIQSLYSEYINDIAYLSVFELDEDKLQKAADIIHKSGLIKQPNNSNLIAYILPVDFYISEIPMEKPDSAACHVYNFQYNPGNLKVIITEGQSKSKPENNGNDILYRALSLKPIMEIHINIESKKILKSFFLNKSSIRYKNIAEPIF